MSTSLMNLSGPIPQRIAQSILPPRTFPVGAILLLLTSSSLWTSRADGADDPHQRPNIVIILADDMGYSDTAPYGGEIETPTLSRLADHGLRFTQFYNTARCCPTRACLLTGLYPHQAGVGWMMADSGYEGYRGDLNNHCLTIAQVLGPAGYQTGAVGKWHVTPHVLPGTSQHNWPLQRGFDSFYGTIHGAGSYYNPNSLSRGNQLISPAADPEYQPETFYYTDAISEHAVRFIDQASQKEAAQDSPFFLYVAFTAAHWPMHALPEDIAKYRGKYDDGYAPIRDARLQRLREMGLVDPQWELSPQAIDWDDVKHPRWRSRCMEVYAAMVDRMDQGVARIVNALKANGQLENTLILFLQDNGGCAEDWGGDSLKRPQEPTFEPLAETALQLDMRPKQTRDGYPVRRGAGVMPGPADTWIAYGKGWANVSNTPFRQYKHWVHEGGISTPLIAHWPQGIKRSGEFERTPGHLIDLMATCVDLAEATYPTEHQGHTITPLPGKTLAPLFHGEPLERDAIYFEHEGNRAVRAGDWKIVAKENQPWELYDMRTDRSEMHDLGKEHPQTVAELEAKWQAWAERSNVLPLGAWHERAGDH